MVSRPVGTNAYEFVIVASLRTHQLMAGCLPRVQGSHKATTIAQMEVAAGEVASAVPEPVEPR
jgi:DNA-directed RNA polymerase subunit K/omega